MLYFSFSYDPVDEADLELILQASLTATSAINQQPWFFAVVTNTDVMAELAGGSAMPAVAAPAGNDAASSGESADAAAPAASSMGYGTKIISSPTMTLNGANHDDLCQKLGVDPALTAVAVLLIGKPDVDAMSSASVRSSMDEKVSFTK